MKTETVELPAFYATYLINNDPEGLEVSDFENLTSFLAWAGVRAGDCLTVDEDTFFARWFDGLGHDMATFTFKSR